MMMHSRRGNTADPDDLYKYSGKEYDTETGYSYFGARSYNGRIGRWMSVDPLADKYPRWSQYNYVMNNPLRLVDPDGMRVDDYFDKTGKHLGNDGQNDGKIFMVDGTAKFDISNFQDGGKYFNNQSKYSGDIGEGYAVTELGFDSEISLLARIGYAEFRGGNDVEQKVGVDITLNRVESPRYPSTLESVIEQAKQYSSLNPDDPNREYYYNPSSTLKNKLNQKAWVRPISNSISVLNGESRGISKGATMYYSARSMNPPYSLPRKWNFNLLTEVIVPGTRSSQIRLFKEK